MSYPQNKPLNILLADDDNDDRFFFGKALKEMTFPTALSTVEDGETLMVHLAETSGNLPDVLFLDLNLRRKNGSECLSAIKANPKLNSLPVIIYSTSLHKDFADLLYKNGALYYVSKRDYSKLIEVLDHLLRAMVDTGYAVPPRESFVLSEMHEVY
jgi:CheY-like chemotaxis protein